MTLYRIWWTIWRLKRADCALETIDQLNTNREENNYIPSASKPSCLICCVCAVKCTDTSRCKNWEPLLHNLVFFYNVVWLQKIIMLIFAPHPYRHIGLEKTLNEEVDMMIWNLILLSLCFEFFLFSVLTALRIPFRLNLPQMFRGGNKILHLTPLNEGWSFFIYLSHYIYGGVSGMVS